MQVQLLRPRASIRTGWDRGSCHARMAMRHALPIGSLVYGVVSDITVTPIYLAGLWAPEHHTLGKKQAMMCSA